MSDVLHKKRCSRKPPGRVHEGTGISWYHHDATMSKCVYVCDASSTSLTYPLEMGSLSQLCI
jgi:hypothetical protein